jgi:ABC-2 type transport system ATP-binding protein
VRIMPSHLKIKDLTKTYQGKTALNNISFNAQKGKILGLLGPNGAGKTSLLRSITQIIKPDLGIILISGEPLAEHHNSKIGYLPEERGLYPQLIVEDQLIFLAQLKGMAKSKAEDAAGFWMEKLKVDSYKRKKVAELSKGMAQKVQFIAAIINNPEIIILDEPFSGFDPVNANQIKQEVIDLKNKGKTIILSTHNMSSVEEICDDIILMNKGELLLKGSVQQIKKQYAKPGAKVVYKGSAIAFSNALWTAFNIENSQTNQEGITTAELTFNKDANINALAKVLSEAVEILSINPIEPSINEIFIDLVSSKNLNENTSA